MCNAVLFPPWIGGGWRCALAHGAGVMAAGTCIGETTVKHRDSRLCNRARTAITHGDS